MVYVIKANGEKAEFDRNKIVRTCKRAGIPQDVAKKIADKVESKIYNGITTKKILDLVLKKLDIYEERHSHKYDLKRAISKLNPGEHEFEKYIEHLLKAQGYKTKWNIIVQGECIEHQIDIIAEKDSKRYLVECKHHVNPHRFCGLGTCLQTWATLDDIMKGYKNGIIKERYDNMWLVVNTKFSEHAIRYAKAKRLILTGWNFPKGTDLRSMAEKKGMYPLTILNLPRTIMNKFSGTGILLLQEFVQTPLDELYKKTSIDKKTLQDLVEKATHILNH